MARDMSGKFGSENYALEECAVDMAAAFVCNTLGLPTDFTNHAAYIDNWLKKIKQDKRDLFRTAATAQRIADWTLGYHPDYAATFSQTATVPDNPRVPVGRIDTGTISAALSSATAPNRSTRVRALPLAGHR
jgi:antirestriction protein ArdC